MVVLSEWLRGIAFALPSSMGNQFLFVKFHSIVIVILVGWKGLESKFVLLAYTKLLIYYV